MNAETIVLGARDVARYLTILECIDAIAETLRAHEAGKSRGPASSGFTLPGGSFHAKLAAIEDDGRIFVAVKANVNLPGNPIRHRRPTIQGALILLDGDDGQPLAIMDSIALTSLRTAAVAALAAEHLALSDSRTITIVGCGEQPLDPRHGELWHLRDSGLVQTVRLDRDHTVVTLTKEGRGLLESRRLDEDSRDRQAFHNGVQKPRELKHDAELYRAYMVEAERLRDEGANIHRIVLENNLKSEYQAFLQERNRDRDDSDGRPDRDPLEIQEWAREHELPCDDQGHVQFPDVRIEYDIDGRDHTVDVEVMTPHYRGAHAAAKSGSGFRLYFSARAGGGRGGGRTPSVIEELLR